MNKLENIEYLKSLPITEYLKDFGLHPHRRAGNNYIYFSPLHHSTIATFCVDTVENRFFDLGGGNVEGDLIYLVQLLKKVSELRAINALQEWIPEDTRRFGRMSGPKCLKEMSNISHSELNVEDMVLGKENIRQDIAKAYVTSITFESFRKKFHGIAYKNDLGGYFIYQPYYLYSSQPNSITSHLGRGSADLQIFENIIDLLKHHSLKNITEADRDIVVLNLRSNYMQLKGLVEEYENIDYFLNMDFGGIQLKAAIQRMRNESNITKP